MNNVKLKAPVLGVIYGNRDFFPDQLVTEARADIAKLFAKFGIKAIQLGEADSKLGGVETHSDARKCAEMGVDGIIAIGTGAGGHTGNLSPFALMQEIRSWWDGLLILSGCIATGRAVLAAEVLGADLAYIGSPFLASHEADTQPAFRQMIVDGSAADIVVTNCFTGVDANFLIPSVIQNGLDPKQLRRITGTGVNIAGGGSNSKAWRDIWSAGQGIGAVKYAEPAGAFVDRLADEYAAARRAIGILA